MAEDWMVTVFKQFTGGETDVLDKVKLQRALKALDISDKVNPDEVLEAMDLDKDGTIDLHEWQTAMTPELRCAILAKLDDADKAEGFKPLVDMAKVFDDMDTDKSGDLSKDEIKAGLACLGIKGLNYDELFRSMDTNEDGTISISEFKYGLPKEIKKALGDKLTAKGLI